MEVDEDTRISRLYFAQLRARWGAGRLRGGRFGTNAGWKIDVAVVVTTTVVVVTDTAAPAPAAAPLSLRLGGLPKGRFFPCGHGDRGRIRLRARPCSACCRGTQPRNGREPTDRSDAPEPYSAVHVDEVVVLVVSISIVSINGRH